MRIVQVLSTIAGGDAVSNDAIAFDKVISRMGYSTGVYAASIAPNVDRGVAKPIEKIGELNKSDIIMYHFSTGSQLNYDIAEYPCHIIMVYHNVTPPKYFEGVDDGFARICKSGLEGAEFLASRVDYCLAVSAYNRQDLIDMGYKCRIDILPIIIPMHDYEKKPSRDIIKDYADGRTNILFTGRIAPNKKIEDVIAAFYYYRKLYNHDSRLLLAGSYSIGDAYYNRLAKYVTKLGIQNDVVFTGHVGFDKILGCYKVADVFLCMSEHEGFCVPLVESMMFDVPIVARATSAIPETLSGSGMLLESADPIVAAGCIDRVVRDRQLRQQLITSEQQRLKDFQYEAIAAKLKDYIEEFIQEQHE